MSISPVAILGALKELDTNKEVVPRSGPTSEHGRQWIIRAIALLHQVDPGRAAAFEAKAAVLRRRLSFERLDDAFNDMIFILETVITELELKTAGLDEKVYSPGAAYDLYLDLRDAIGGAMTFVFVVDPYADEEIFDLYFAKCPPNVHIRLLTGRITPGLRAVITKFRQKPAVNFEVRFSDEIHDRVIFRDDACWVIGTSIGRHAATKKPTYLKAVHNVEAMRAPYDEIWARATPA